MQVQVLIIFDKKKSHFGKMSAPTVERLCAAADAKPPRALQHELTPADNAQSEVNFVVLVPPHRVDAHGESVQTYGTLRREAAPAIRADVGGGKWPAWSTASPCSFRFEVLFVAACCI